VKTIQVDVRILSIEDILNSDSFGMDYFENPTQRAKFQQWLNKLWTEKDQTIKNMAKKG
jgi:hypothetical protein